MYALQYSFRNNYRLDCVNIYLTYVKQTEKRRNNVKIIKCVKLKALKSFMHIFRILIPNKTYIGL